MGIAYSSDSGTLQLIFKCHSIGLMWRRLRWTCFSVTVSNLITGISCQTRHVGLERRFLILHSRSDSALGWVELVAYEVEDLLEVQFWFLHVNQPIQLLTNIYQSLSMLETGLVRSGSDQTVALVDSYTL